MRALAIILTIACFATLPSRAQDSSSSSVVVHFTVPKEWTQVNDSVFVLKDYGKAFEEWSHQLADGHMPWRLGTANTAVKCLWEFGIRDTVHALVWDFAACLTEIRKDQVFSLTVGTRRYTVYLRSRSYEDRFKDGQGHERTQEYSIPVAYKLEITRASQNGG